MTVLSESERAQIWKGLMRYNDKTREPVNISNLDLRAAVDDIDLWVEDNASSFNVAIGQPARNALSAQQKALMLAIVTLMRYDVGFVRKLLGVID